MNCGSRGKPLVVHVDRLRLKHNQVLRNEQDHTQESSAENLNISTYECKESDPSIDIPSEVDSNLEILCSGIIRKAPSWLSDYVVY